MVRKAHRPYSPTGDCRPKKGHRGLGRPSGEDGCRKLSPPEITQCSLTSSHEKLGVGEWGEVGANTPWPVVPFLSREVERVPSPLLDFCSSFKLRCHCFCNSFRWAAKGPSHGCIYMYPFSLKLYSHPGCHLTLSRRLCILSTAVPAYAFLEAVDHSARPGIADGDLSPGDSG